MRDEVGQINYKVSYSDKCDDQACMHVLGNIGLGLVFFYFYLLHIRIRVFTYNENAGIHSKLLYIFVKCE